MDNSFWNHKNVVVTGGSGFIGRWLVRALEAGKAQVHIFDYTPQPTLEGMYTYHQADLMDLRRTADLIAEIEPDVVLHLAGQAGVPNCHNDPIMAFQSNVQLTTHILEACRMFGGIESIVAVSSNHVYGEQKMRPTPEDTPLNGTGIYATSKLCADVIARAYGKTYGLPVGIARITNSFGGDDPHETHIITSTIISLLHNEQPVIMQSGRDTKGYLYVKDTVNGLLTLAEKVAVVPELHGEAFNFVPDAPVSVSELIATILEVMGKQIEPVVHNPLADYEYEYLDNAKARRLLGWSPQYTLCEGFKETIQWYSARKNPA